MKLEPEQTNEAHLASVPRSGVARVLFGDRHPRDPHMVSADWRKLMWLFVVGSFIGLVGENTEHFIMFNGELESHGGAIWGPFSPIYGTGLVLLTIILEPLRDRGIVRMFLVAAVAGGLLEYLTSWAMESFWGVVAWSYLSWPLNFDGRTCLFYMSVWGLIGMVWVFFGIPLVNRAYEHINDKGRMYKVVTWAVTVFMVVDLATTVVVLLRADALAHGIPPQNPIECFIDETWPADSLHERFGSMGGLGSA